MMKPKLTLMNGSINLISRHANTANFGALVKALASQFSHHPHGLDLVIVKHFYLGVA
jgi:hypothetical protein